MTRPDLSERYFEGDTPNRPENSFVTGIHSKTSCDESINGLVKPKAEIVSSRAKDRGSGRDESFSEASLTLPFAPISSSLASISDKPDWLLTGFVARGVVTLFAGRPKVGKTMLNFALFRAVATGAPFLGLETGKTGVLLLSEERGATLTEKRDFWGVDIHLLMRHQAYGTPWAEIVEQAVTYCHEHEIGLLVIDTWDKWTNLTGDSENSAGAVIAALEPLQRAAASGLAVLILAHQRKSYGEHGDAVRGSNALTGSVDVIVELERPKGETGGNARILRTTSRFIDAPPELIAELTENGYEAKGDLASYEAEGERTKLLDALGAAGKPLTAPDLHEATEIPKGTVHKRMGELMDRGECVRGGAGKKSDPFRWVLSSQTALLGDESNSEEQQTLEETRRQAELANENGTFGLWADAP
jgi:AAA domain/IclR helix-turn-helix domain